MPGQPIRFGPFVGGLNTLSDPTALDDQELVDCVNFELDLDGSLISRPPVADLGNNAGFSSRILLLGYGIFSSGSYLIGSTSGGVYYFSAGAWNLITSTIKSTSIVQFNDKVFILATADSGATGGYWTPGGGYVNVASMPKGQTILVHKSRLFVCPGELATTNGSRVSFSATSDGTSWPGTNTLDVGPGDGENVVDIIVYNDNLVCFKNDSTYVFSFDSNPGTGTVRKISATIGATTKKCCIIYENALYVYHEGNVYEIVNFDFARLNSKVPFFYDPTKPSPYSEEVFLCLFGDRLMVRYYNRVYLFGMRTRTWTRWQSDFYYGFLVAEPINVVQAINARYFAGSCIFADKHIYQINDGFDNVQQEDMVCSIVTKNYDLANSFKFKRLFWWGADVNAVSEVVGTVTPIVYSFSVTWGALVSTEWDDLETWGSPTLDASLISTVATPASGTVRRFIKFLKSIRFRQVNFKVDLSTTGRLIDAPCRVFNITGVIDTKETVSKQVS